MKKTHVFFGFFLDNRSVPLHNRFEVIQRNHEQEKDGLGEAKMSIIKCPRCEINFIKEEDGYCAICKKEMSGEAPKEESIDVCMECGNSPVVAGEELCKKCLKEHRLITALAIEEELKEEEVDGDSSSDEAEEILDEDLAVDEAMAQDIPVELSGLDSEWDDDDDVDEFDGFYEEDIYEKQREEKTVS